jgi:hypothetical protein
MLTLNFVGEIIVLNTDGDQKRSIHELS